MVSKLPVVHLIDDDLAILTALRRLLSSQAYVVACHSSAEDFLGKHDPSVPGCAVVDLGLPGLDGFDIQDNLKSDATARPVIFLTGRGDIPASVKAMKAGAVDFLTKPVDASALLDAIANALQRDGAARKKGDEVRSVDDRLSKLTPREREVLGQVVAGRLNKQIAAHLGTAEKTVKVHRGRMMRKMGVRTVADLVRLTSQ